MFRRLLNHVDHPSFHDGRSTVGDAFDVAFGLLKILGCRDEYIYRAALTNKILMGKHSLRTASMLTEFRAGNCKADLVILNGTATVYEIKSERDSLTRLSNQIQNYERVFATINVIASEDHVYRVLAVVPEDVGVLCLSRRYQISQVRDAADRPERICPMAVFESLRSAEAKAILTSMGVPVPTVPNTQRHAVMRELFAHLEPRELHVSMVSVLKRSRSLAPLSDLVSQLPESLHAAALTVPIRRRDHDRLVNVVSSPLRSTVVWA